MRRARKGKWIALLCIGALVLSSCSSNEDEIEENAGDEAVSEENTEEAEDGEEDLSSEEEQEGNEDVSAEDTGQEELITPVDSIDTEDQFTDRDLDPSYDEDEAIYIELETNSATADSSSGIEIENESDGADKTQITIEEEGVYVFSGTLSYGQILVACEDEDAKVQIVLNGADITNNDSACILVQSADKLFITLEEGTENKLSDTGEEYVQPEDMDKTVDGVVFADCDVTLAGDGSLEINAGYAQGIVSKNDIRITGGTIEITSAGKGMEANDSIRIYDGTVNIDSEDDGFNTDNEEEFGKGYIYIENGTLTIDSGDDGIHAATALLIEGGSITVTNSYEGLEGDTIDILGGDIDITSSDDGLNASTGSGDNHGGGGDPGNSGDREEPQGERNGGGEEGVPGNANDSGETSDTGETSDSGDAGDSGEESDSGETRDAETRQDDDFVPEQMSAVIESDENNASNPDDGENREGNHAPGNGGGMTSQAAYISISGGTIHIDADGDGIDSNGDIYIEGGTITVDGPTSGGNGALDYGEGSAEAIVSGGSIIAVGSMGMAENFTESSTQYAVMYNFSSELQAGTEIIVTDAEGTEIFSYTPAKEFQSVVFSFPELEEGEYTISAGEEEDTFTIESIITEAGEQGGTGGGHQGGGGGGGRGHGEGPGGGGGGPQGGGEAPQGGGEAPQEGSGAQEAGGEASQEGGEVPQDAGGNPG